MASYIILFWVIKIHPAWQWTASQKNFNLSFKTKSAQNGLLIKNVNQLAADLVLLDTD